MPPFAAHNLYDQPYPKTARCRNGPALCSHCLTCPLLLDVKSCPACCWLQDVDASSGDAEQLQHLICGNRCCWNDLWLLARALRWNMLSGRRCAEQVGMLCANIMHSSGGAWAKVLLKRLKVCIDIMGMTVMRASQTCNLLVSQPQTSQTLNLKHHKPTSHSLLTCARSSQANQPLICCKTAHAAHV